MDLDTSDQPGYDDFNSYDANQLSRQEKINRAKRNKTREQASAKTLTPNKFISDRTRHVAGFGMFDNQGFEAEITNNDSYEKFSRHKSNARNSNDIDNYVPQRQIKVAGVTRDETRVGYSSNENSEDEKMTRMTEKANNARSKEKHSKNSKNDIEEKIEDLKISQNNDPKTQ
jgi:hypothetical protein